MEPETVLNLFDSFWFHNTLEKQSETTSNPAPPMIQENIHSPKPSQLTMERRSRSLDPADISFSPNSVLDDKPHHLQTILSDREFFLEMPEVKKPISKVLNINKKKKRLSKSLSELEFEELKGFMDLGFVFSEEDKMDSSLSEIIPGLRKIGHKKMDCSLSDHDQEGTYIEEQRARPYLSEAWDQREDEEREALMKWRVPAIVGDEIDMKDSLKWWAHSVVASAVR